MNPVLILTHNCLELTKRCVESVLAQDIPVDIMLIDNGSTDGTPEWFDSPTSNLDGFIWAENRGVSVGWNYGIGTIFAEQKEAGHILCLNNDIYLPPWYYRKLLDCDALFVTGASVDSMESIMRRAEPSLTPGPDFSAFLIRREAWEKIGPFDENMVLYAQDLDYDIRARRMGITLLNSHVPFYHERSSTLKMATPADRREIQLQADMDRDTFRAKWRCLPGEPGYEELFQEESWQKSR